MRKIWEVWEPSLERLSEPNKLEDWEIHLWVWSCGLKILKDPNIEKRFDGEKLSQEQIKKGEIVCLVNFLVHCFWALEKINPMSVSNTDNNLHDINNINININDSIEESRRDLLKLGFPPFQPCDKNPNLMSIQHPLLKEYCETKNNNIREVELDIWLEINLGCVDLNWEFKFPEEETRRTLQSRITIKKGKLSLNIDNHKFFYPKQESCWRNSTGIIHARPPNSYSYLEGGQYTWTIEPQCDPDPVLRHNRNMGKITLSEDLTTCPIVVSFRTTESLYDDIKILSISTMEGDVSYNKGQWVIADVDISGTPRPKAKQVTLERDLKTEFFHKLLKDRLRYDQHISRLTVDYERIH